MDLFFVGTLDDDEEVVFVWGNHHFVLLASHTQESQVVGGVQVSHQVPGLSRQTRQFHSVVSRFWALRHGRLHELRLTPFFVFLVRHYQQTLHSFVLLNPCYSLFHLALFIKLGSAKTRWETGKFENALGHLPF